MQQNIKFSTNQLGWCLSIDIYPESRQNYAWYYFLRVHVRRE
jgi:hypothetical protein